MNCIDLTSKQSKMWRYVAKLQKWSNYNELHRFDVKKIKPTQNYKSDQIIMNCIDLTSERSKLLSYVAKLQNDQILVHCIDLTSNRSKTLRYIAKHSKQRKTTKLINYNELHWLEVKTIRKSKTRKVIKLQWIASIWCQKDQTNAKLQKWSNYNELHRFDVKTIKTFELRRKTTKVIKFQWIASIWHQNNQNCWVTSKNIENYAKLQNDQIIVHCIDLTSKRLKTLRYAAKLQK